MVANIRRAVAQVKDDLPCWIESWLAQEQANEQPMTKRRLPHSGRTRRGLGCHHRQPGRRTERHRRNKQYQPPLTLRRGGQGLAGYPRPNRLNRQGAEKVSGWNAMNLVRKLLR